MARIPEDEIERIKSEVSVQRLVEAAGIELKRVGRDLAARCPFHEEETASFKVTPAKNLWRCFGCNEGGGPIDWVMKARGVSFRHAVELLKADPALAAGAPRKATTVRALAAPVSFDANEQALLAQVVDYYHQQLKDNEAALAYLKVRGLVHPQLIETFKLGVGDRTLGLRLPLKNRAAGADIRGRLQRVGILRESGHEHFNGCLVVPVLDERGQVLDVYGRQLNDDKRREQARHLYLRQPEEGRRSRGVFNIAGIVEAGQRPQGQREVIQCEAILDALSFWSCGYTNVTASYGTSGFTADMLEALKANHIERVLIAYDRDEAGEAGARELAAHLIAEGFEVLRVQFPKGMDANEFACKMSPPEKALALVVRQAEWIGSGRPSVQPVELAPTAAPAAKTAAKEEGPEPATFLAAKTPGAPQHSTHEPAGALPDEVQLEAAACTWRIRGWKKNATPEAMRVNVQVRCDKSGGYFVDTLDVYAARARASFVKQASVELGVGEDAVKRELGAVLMKLEGLQDELMAQARKPQTPTAPILSAEEEAEAMQLLRSPDLMQRIVQDLHALGVVGEDMNLVAAYLAAVSRKLDAPLAVLIQSTSAAGKSALMDAVLNLVPPEERIRYSAMTGQSLYYLGETNLQHKILAIAEEEGVRQAAYALKLLQSDGELTIASTAKDEATGNLQTRQYTVKGPVMLMLTTTAIDVDEELLNRCLVLSVNESREQTAAIHARQRHKQTLEGLLQSAGRERVQALHHNAQRLLASVAVVNPYADQLTFLADKTRTRRDHMKYLTLIRAIALVHQHQREVKSVEHAGQQLHYIEVTKGDIALANRVAHEVLGRTLDEMPPQTRKLLRLIAAMVAQRASDARITPAQVRFTRRDVRGATGWSDNQLKVHCARLADMEYLLVHAGSRGHSFSYELLWDGGGEDDERRLCGLIETEALETGPSLRPTQVGVEGAQDGLKMASSGGHVGGKLEWLDGRASCAHARLAGDGALAAAAVAS
ncbi:CHC2 zinc finger domain-containing protein [Variovorax terrae]|uniref:CHC2 zinc finger domain-containing protein n=1 Tax=Variovorax terrae TaxID=2923278 RepID=A0A9X2AP62_9BURK|nr:CHC2 zinc finger domain-containing protein [Variovorax terrae]MCJ0764517.1 CHC2 zinc finger domain-containing protein [Variovorax terrae]MCJ0764525.1 CHC2 zinc finger domain-containing protein [Variovorax terrae]